MASKNLSDKRLSILVTLQVLYVKQDGVKCALVEQRTEMTVERKQKKARSVRTRADTCYVSAACA